VGAVATRLRDLPAVADGVTAFLLSPARWATALATTGRTVGLDIADAVRRFLAGVGAATIGIGVFLRATARRLRTASLSATLAWLVTRVRSLWRRPERDAEREDDDTARTDSDGTDEREQRSIEALWRSFARRVTPAWRTRTAGEISRRAVERGHPSEPVGTLAETFRTAAYAPGSPAEAAVERAREAYGQLTGEGDE
jgi:hypothetical protein